VRAPSERGRIEKCAVFYINSTSKRGINLLSAVFEIYAIKATRRVASERNGGALLAMKLAFDDFSSRLTTQKK
jgi:hypothetical protein